jgi:hypothetical protein
VDEPRQPNDDPHHRPLPRCGGCRPSDPEDLVRAILSEAPDQTFAWFSHVAKQECRHLRHGPRGTYLSTLQHALSAGNAFKRMREVDPGRFPHAVDECTGGRPDLAALFETLVDEWPWPRQQKMSREDLIADYDRIMIAVQN